MSSALWFRHGLRLHDNPALLEALQGNHQYFYPIFIFDGESAGTQLVGYNRMRFLLESLNDLNSQLKKVGGRLYVLKGSPTEIFRKFWEELGLAKLCFEQDCEPIWRKRDDAVKALCRELGIGCVEKVSHTLWDPFKVVEANGGSPPLTYEMFLHTVSTIGLPPRPEAEADFGQVKFGKIPPGLAEELGLFGEVPTPEELGVFPETENAIRLVRWIGGETQAMRRLMERMQVEERAFLEGYYLPNQSRPDLLALPTSQSAALRFGCLSVRLFYWKVHDLFARVHGARLPATPYVTGQLIWREYFYTMSVNNIHYAEMSKNPICLNISWDTSMESRSRLKRWIDGQTGYPFIDAAMRQLRLEGWIHHVARNAVACFLTRGDLWISWEEGLQHFLKQLIDADWSVCAGNWMWVSSSAFEQLLDCSVCVCPVSYGKRLDPSGEYVRRYVPELRNLDVRYVYEPWAAPIREQERANCVIGRDYPERMVDHAQVSRRNRERMHRIRDGLVSRPAHCCPSSEEETRQFMWIAEGCAHGHALTLAN